VKAVSTEAGHVDSGSNSDERGALRPRVLVVDDEDLVRLVIARTLRLRGFDVSEARDGLDALSLIAASAPDLVLTDLNMPRCNGERLCLEIKRQPATAHIRVVLMTGGPLEEARLKQMGCAAVVYKPLPDRLPELLADILRDAAPASHSAA
jgi:two-component system chemotaxis response regulator CheY